MKELMQAKSFYDGLELWEQEDLCKAIAEDIFFLDEDLQRDVLELLHAVAPYICVKVMEINSFTS